MALNQTVCVAVICVIISLTGFVDGNNDDDYVNPTDLLNFDPVNIRMIDKAQGDTKKKEKPIQAKEIPSNDGNLNRVPSKSNDNPREIKKKPLADTVAHCPKPEDEALKAIFKRFLMSLVQHIESKIESHDVPVEFCMRMKASYNDLLLMKHYGMGTADNLHEVHDALDKMMLYAMELPDESRIYWLEKKIGLSVPVLLLVIATFLVGILVARMLMKIRLTRSLFARTILLLFLISTVSTYMELYQQKVAKQEKVLTEEMSGRCPHLSDSAFSRLTGYLTSAVTFQDENCREYYEAVVVNPLFQVSVLEAGGMAIVKILVAPMKIIGQGFSDFIVGLFKDLPVQYTLPLFSVMLVIFILFPFLAFGYTLKIPFLLSIQPPPTPQIEYVPSESMTVKDKCLPNASVPGLTEGKPAHTGELASDVKKKPEEQPTNNWDTDKMVIIPSLGESVCACQKQEGMNASSTTKEGNKESSELSMNHETCKKSDTPVLTLSQQHKDKQEKSMDNGTIESEGITSSSVQSEARGKGENVFSADFFLAHEVRIGDKVADSDLCSPRNVNPICDNNSENDKATDLPLLVDYVKLD